MNYKDSGVDLHSQDMFNAQLCQNMPWLGGFAGAFDIGDDYLVSSTDGVGTKVKLYTQALKENGVSINNLGIDLVAMVMNDIVCTGAKPIFFNDYLAVNKIEQVDALGLIAGINEGLSQCGSVPLLGGETAIMGDMYKSGEFDVAGFGVGVCPKDKFIDGTKIAENDIMIGLHADGFHSNGYTLIREVVSVASMTNPEDFPTDLFADLLKPTRIYVKPILRCLDKFKGGIHGIAHITGGGRANVNRLMGDDLNLRPKWFDDDHKTDEMKWIQKYGNISDEEFRRVFNNGIGMVVIASREIAGEMIELLEAMGERVSQVGVIENRLNEEYNNTLKV